MSDRREEILQSVFNKYKSLHPADNWASWESIKEDGTSDITYNAMDEYMKECCLELLEYMAKANVRCWYDDEDKSIIFMYRGEYLSKEQLFEIFL